MPVLYLSQNHPPKPLPDSWPQKLWDNVCPFKPRRSRVLFYVSRDKMHFLWSMNHFSIYTMGRLLHRLDAELGTLTQWNREGIQAVWPWAILYFTWVLVSSSTKWRQKEHLPDGVIEETGYTAQRWNIWSNAKWAGKPAVWLSLLNIFPFLPPPLGITDEHFFQVIQ